jgi:6-phosphofructokinase 1
MTAVEMVVRERWGNMVALRGTDMIEVPFSDALGQLKTVPQARYDEARVLFG